MRIVRIAGATLAGGLSVAGVVVLAQAILAQTAAAQTAAAAQAGGPGPRLTFGLSQTFDFNDNLDLDVPSAGNTAQALTGLSFGLTSDTGIAALDFFAGTALRVIDGPDTGETVELDLDGTRVGLAYDRAVSNAALTVRGSYTMDQIDTTLTLADFGPGAEVPEDFGNLTGTGMRRFFSLGATLGLGLDDPVSYEAFATVSVLDYSDTSASDLTGNNRARVGAALVARLNEVTTGRLALAYGEFTSNDPDVENSDNIGLDLGLTRQLTNGTVGLSVFTDEYSDSADSRTGFSLSRDMTLPAGTLGARLGATQVENADPELTGGLAWNQQLPNGALNLAANSGVQNDSDNQAQYVTGVRFGYAHTLDPLSQIGFDLSYAQTENVRPPVDSSSAASISAIYSRNVTPDWALDFGYTYRQSNEDTTDTARSNSVFVGLRRSWTLRP